MKDCPKDCPSSAKFPYPKYPKKETRPYMITTNTPAAATMKPDCFWSSDIDQTVAASARQQGRHAAVAAERAAAVAAAALGQLPRAPLPRAEGGHALPRVAAVRRARREPARELAAGAPPPFVSASYRVDLCTRLHSRNRGVFTKYRLSTADRHAATEYLFQG